MYFGETKKHLYPNIHYMDKEKLRVRYPKSQTRSQALLPSTESVSDDEKLEIDYSTTKYILNDLRRGEHQIIPVEMKSSDIGITTLMSSRLLQLEQQIKLQSQLLKEKVSNFQRLFQITNYLGGNDQ